MAITSGCSVVYPWAAIIIGIVAGIIYVFASHVSIRLKVRAHRPRACVCACACGEALLSQRIRPLRVVKIGFSACVCKYAALYSTGYQLHCVCSTSHGPLHSAGHHLLRHATVHHVLPSTVQGIICCVVHSTVHRVQGPLDSAAVASVGRLSCVRKSSASCIVRTCTCLASRTFFGVLRVFCQ